MGRQRTRANVQGFGSGMIEDLGAMDVNVLYVPANVADTETVVIGAHTYEFDRAANGVTAGRTAVTGHADDTPTNATNALIAAINANKASKVKAIDIGNSEILIRRKRAGAFALACTETLAGSGNVWAAATMYGGRAPSSRAFAAESRVPTATEVTLGNMHFFFPFVPNNVIVDVQVTATGIKKAWVGGITIGNDGRVTLDNAGATDWAATDTIHVLAIGA